MSLGFREGSTVLTVTVRWTYRLWSPCASHCAVISPKWFDSLSCLPCVDAETCVLSILVRLCRQTIGHFACPSWLLGRWLDANQDDNASLLLLFLLSPTWPSVATFATLLRLAENLIRLLQDGECIECLSVNSWRWLSELLAGSVVRSSFGQYKAWAKNKKWL